MTRKYIARSIFVASCLTSAPGWATSPMVWIIPASVCVPDDEELDPISYTSGVGGRVGTITADTIGFRCPVFLQDYTGVTIDTIGITYKDSSTDTTGEGNRVVATLKKISPVTGVWSSTSYTIDSDDTLCTDGDTDVHACAIAIGAGTLSPAWAWYIALTVSRNSTDNTVEAIAVTLTDAP